MRLGASLFRGFSPSQRKSQPPSAYSGVPFPNVGERSTHRAVVGTTDEGAASELTCSGSKKSSLLPSRLKCGDPPTFHKAKATRKDDPKVIVPTNASCIRRASIACSQREAFTATPSFGYYDASGSECNSNAGNSNARNSGPCITNSLTSTNHCQPTRPAGTLKNGAVDCSDARDSAAFHIPTSGGADCSKTVHPPVTDSESRLGRRESQQPHKKVEIEKCDAGVRTNQRSRNSNSKILHNVPSPAGQYAARSAQDIHETGQHSSLKTKLNLLRAGSRSRLSRTLTAATGSVLRRLTPHAASRRPVKQDASATTLHPPFVSALHAGGARAVSPHDTYEDSFAGLAALPTRGAAGASFRDTAALPVASFRAKLSLQNRAVAVGGSSLIPQFSHAIPYAATTYHRTAGKLVGPSIPPMFTPPEMSGFSQSSAEFSGMTVPAKKSETCAERLPAAHTARPLSGESADTPPSAMLKRSVQAALVGTSKSTLTGDPHLSRRHSPVDLCASSPRRRSPPRTHTHSLETPMRNEACNGSRSNETKTKYATGGEQFQNSPPQTAESGSSSIMREDEASCSSDSPALESAGLPHGRNPVRHNLGADAAGRSDEVTSDYEWNVLVTDFSSLRPKVLSHAAPAQRQLQDGQLSEAPGKKIPQQTTRSTSPSSFSKRRPSTVVSTQRRSSRSARICYETISHHRVEAVYVCPEGGQIPLLKSLKVTQDTTRKDETLNQEEEEERETREEQPQTQRDFRCPHKSGRRRPRKEQAESEKAGTHEVSSNRDKGVRKTEQEEAERKSSRAVPKKEERHLVSEDRARSALESEGNDFSHSGRKIVPRVDSYITGLSSKPSSCLRHQEREARSSSSRKFIPHGGIAEQVARQIASPDRRSPSTRRTRSGVYRERSWKGRGVSTVVEEHKDARSAVLEATAAAGATHSLETPPQQLNPERQEESLEDKYTQADSDDARVKELRRSSLPQGYPGQMHVLEKLSSYADFPSTCSPTREGSPGSMDFTSRSSGTLQSYGGSPHSPLTSPVCVNGHTCVTSSI